MQKKIAVLGGGISGLSTSFLLLKHLPNINVHLYESSQSIGGALTTEKLPFSSSSFLEMGPSSLRKSYQINELMKILRDTSLLHEIVPSKEYPQVYLYYDEKMRVFPRSFRPSVLLNFAKDNKKFVSSFLKPTLNHSKTIFDNNDLSIKEFINKKTTKGFLEFPQLREQLHEISGALFNGIYASDIAELSSNICWNKCHHEMYYAKFLENQEYKKFQPEIEGIIKQYLHTSTSFSFKKGLNTLPQGILKYLQEKYPDNFVINFNESISEVNFTKESNSFNVNNRENIYDMVISALPLPELLRIFSKNSIFKESKAFETMKKIKFKSIARANLYFDEDVLPKELQSFGFLNLPKEKEEVLGMTFDSKVFPSENKETRCSLMIGDEILKKYQFKQDRLLELIEKYLAKRLNIVRKAKEVKIKIWNNYMPVFGVGHYEEMTKLLQEIEALNKNFRITGNYIFSAAVPEIVLFNTCLVKSIK